MKKTFLLLLIAVFTLSCEGPMGPRGPQGPEGPGTDWVVKDFEVPENQWVKVIGSDGLFLNYEFVFEIPELTQSVYDGGFVIAYIEGGNNIQYQLPEISHQEDKDGKRWSKVVKCDFGIGTIRFTVSNSDFREDNPGTIKFRVYFGG